MYDKNQPRSTTASSDIHRKKCIPHFHVSRYVMRFRGESRFTVCLPVNLVHNCIESVNCCAFVTLSHWIFKSLDHLTLEPVILQFLISSHFTIDPVKFLSIKTFKSLNLKPLDTYVFEFMKLNHRLFKFSKHPSWKWLLLTVVKQL